MVAMICGSPARPEQPAITSRMSASAIVVWSRVASMVFLLFNRPPARLGVIGNRLVDGVLHRGLRVGLSRCLLRSLSGRRFAWFGRRFLHPQLCQRFHDGDTLIGPVAALSVVISLV